MSGKTATVIGATGLVGGHLLQLLLHEKKYDRIRLIVRRQAAIELPGADIKIISFENNMEFENAISGSDVVFCAVGTTQKKVKGDQLAYRKIDFDIPVTAAKLCKRTGCNTFVFVSSVGANSKSNNFYLNLKGETEDSIKEFSLKQTHIMRPSVLLGSRKESRAGEKIAGGMMSAFSFLLMGKFRKYKPMEAENVAKAMLAASLLKQEGFTIYEYDDMIKLINGK
ncbi:MAG: NAD(P)H-binding protein [Chitinophagaceae bacterium]|nr:NAD(P)H-binding protein [Chitinophagaceae bacterium]